jgi:reverse gyrase
MAATARQGTIDKVNSALAAVAAAQTALDNARAGVLTAENTVNKAQQKVGLALRAFRGELELRVADVANYVTTGGNQPKLYVVELEDGDAFDLASATKIRDYLVSVQQSRL